MSHKVDNAEIAASRQEAVAALSEWKNGEISTEVMFANLLHWVGLEIAMAIQDRDEHGAWR